LRSAEPCDNGTGGLGVGINTPSLILKLPQRLRFFIYVLLLLGIISPTLAQDSAWCVSVWYPSSDAPGGMDAILANAAAIQTVNPFWYTPRPDGTLQLNDGAEDAEELATWRAAGLTIVPTIFGNVPAPIMDAELREQHIATIVDLVERREYDGIDIDYESFPLVSREPFTIFIETLAEELHARDKLLTIAVHPKTNEAGTGDATAAQDWSRLAPVVDEFRIMTYDYQGRNAPPSPIAPIEWVVEVLAYAETIVPDMSRVRVGVPFYGYSWKRGGPPATTVSWSSVNLWMQSFQPEIQRDPADMEMMVDLKVTGLPRQTIYLTDNVALLAKLERIQAAYPDIGGIAVWGIGGEDPANWDVLNEFIHCD
jgi:spore germination protein